MLNKTDDLQHRHYINHPGPLAGVADVSELRTKGLCVSRVRAS